MAVKPAIAQFAGGEGTEGEPWQVATLDQLQKVGEPEYLDKHFILANDIDASETADWHDGKGFVPIGSDVVPFTGFFNGNGFNIENLSIQRETEDFIGLFGITGHESEIINVALEDVNIAGKSHVGGLIGKNLGLVADCSISGTVTGTANRIGGLA